MFHVNVKHWRNLVAKMSCFVCMKLKKGETCISGIVTVRKQDTERVVFLMFLCALLCLSFVLCRAGNRPPNIYIEPASKDIYFKPGETVQIECVANGTPEPRYIWKRNAEVFNPSGQDARVVQLPNQGTLVFNNPEPKDEGIFQCFADNGYGVSASLKVNFKEGTLKKFAYEPKRTHTVQAGNYLTLPCTPPQSIPTADVYWVYRSADGRWEAINFNKRITMDFEGKLRITNARKVDEAGGRTYCCMVSNYFMRVNAVGPEHQVKVIGVTEYKRPAHELWTSPSDQFFLKGETLKLKCIFAGSPTPEVYWERIGGSFPDRAAFRSFGQELQIKDLEFSDAGQYQCMGLNSQSTQRATKAFNVRIEAKPYWVNEPSDIEASVGGTATFICRAEGVPTPDYKWYINGVLLEDRQNKVGVRDPRIYNNLRFFKPNKNNITLVNLTLDDHMNVQCNASNNHGYVFSDVYLSVLAEKPVIIKLPPAQKKVTEGQAVMLDCLVTGKPDPVVTWYRGYSRITGGRFQIMSNGNLYIRKVIMSDAGDYHCQAQNTYGNVTSPSCKTTIIRRTRIKEHPGDLEVIEGDEAKFTCSGSTDFDEAKNMLVYWEKDDKILYSSQQRITQNIHDNSLTISATITRDSGVYTCVVTNGLDEDRAYAILTVKGRPDPPSSVVIERCRDDSATVKWVKGIENNTPVQYFIIQYNTSFYPDQWVSAKSVDYTQSIATVDLKPWGNYTFRVIAANKIGSSSPSLHTQQVCSTKPGRPDKNPRNLRSLGDQRNLLKLHWTPMNEMEHHGPGFRYLLTVRERGGTKSDTFSINNWRDNVIEIPSNKSAYSPYLVKLQAKNNIGDAREEVIENVIYSFEDIPTVRPYDVKVLYLGDRFAKISWKWDRAWLDNDGKTNKIRGEMKGFKIQYWRTSDKLTSFSEANVFMEHIIPPDSSLKVQNIVSEFRLSNLYPYSSMQVQVRVMNNYYVGPASDLDSFTTLEGVSGPVTWFQVLSRSSNSVFLTWQKPSEEDCNGVLLGYELGFQTVDGITLGVMQDQILQVSNPDTEKTLIGGLLPARKYRFHIYPLTRRGKGEGTFVEVTTTSESMQTSPVFEIDHITSYTINVTWASESSITEHSVHYVEFRKKGAAAWQKSMDEVVRNYTLLSALEAGTNYEIRVVAFDGYNRFYSKIKVVRTEGFVTPRALAANYGWFVVMLTSEVFMVSATVIIFMLYRHRRNVRESPRYKRGIVIMDAVTTRRFFHHQDSFARKPLIKNYTQTKIDSKHRRRGHRRRIYRGRLYESVRLQNECDNGSVSNDQSDSYEDDRKLSKESNYYYASDSEQDTDNDYNDYCITYKDSIREKQDKNSYAVECNSTNESDTSESYELENYSDLSLEYSYRKTDTDDDSNNANVDQILDIYTDIKDMKSNNGINRSFEEKSFSDEENSNESDEEYGDESDEEYGDESDDEIDNDDEDSDDEHGYEEEDDADDETSSFDENVLCADTQPDKVVVEYKSTCTNNNNKNSYTHKRQKH